MSWRWYPESHTIWRVIFLCLQVVSTSWAKRHVVYWNSTNARLTEGNYSIQVDLNDYLDILCPHYPDGVSMSSPPEMLALYLVAEGQFRGCEETKGAIKRWECNSPYAPFGPVRFSEKIQRFTPFSLGFEFLPGHHYYYSSLSADDGPPLPCMKLRVTVCCESTTVKPKKVHSPRTKDSSVKSTLLPVLLFIPFLLILFA